MFIFLKERFYTIIKEVGGERMHCSYCGRKIDEDSRYCSHCGKKQKRSKGKILFFLSLIVSVVIGSFIFYYNQKITQLEQEAKNKDEQMRETVEQAKEIEDKLKEEEEKKAATDLLLHSQEKVYTIFTDISQGSGFLMNEKGDVLTNAHVVEGYFEVVIKDVNGKSYKGKVIGYSSDTDIAIVRVNRLQGKEPLQLDRDNKAKIKEEVLALGSPNGVENATTFGYITGTNRNFVIENRTYKNVYQMSAPVASGSSGGPLLSLKSGKVIAINAAKNDIEDKVGFSIPIYTVIDTLEEWVENPMTKKEIETLFTDQNGDYFYRDYDNEEGYFEGGTYDSKDLWKYYEIPYGEENNEDSWDYYEYPFNENFEGF